MITYKQGSVFTLKTLIQMDNSIEKQNHPPYLCGNSYIPQKGDLFEWCDEKYWCIESGNFSGVVNPIGETFYQRGFIWNYGGEKPIFVRKATEQEFENIFGVL